jgi:hypothetical protein
VRPYFPKESSATTIRSAISFCARAITATGPPPDSVKAVHRCADEQLANHRGQNRHIGRHIVGKNRHIRGERRRGREENRVIQVT